MTIIRNGDTILNIEYTDKEIRRHFDRTTKAMEYDCYLDDRYVGTAGSYTDAASKLDALVFEALRRTA